MAGGETNAAVALTDWWKTFHDAELDLLIERAVRSNLDLRMAQARVHEARAQYAIAAADRWPAAATSASYERQQQSQNQPLLSSFSVPPSAFENNVYQAGFDASWEIDVFGGKRRAEEAAGARVGASEFGRREVLITLLGDVARNYVDLRGFQGRLAIANANIEAQQRTLAITRDRFAKEVRQIKEADRRARVFVSEMARKRELNEGLLVQLMRGGQTAEFVHAFARLGDIDVKTAQRIVQTRNTEGIAIVCRSARFDRATFSALALLIDASPMRSSGATQELLGLYDQVTPEAAQRVMRFWKVRREASSAAAPAAAEAVGH